MINRKTCRVVTYRTAAKSNPSWHAYLVCLHDDFREELFQQLRTSIRQVLHRAAGRPSQLPASQSRSTSLEGKIHVASQQDLHAIKG